jgi:hypothetical protein
MVSNLTDEIDVRRIAFNFGHYQDELEINQGEKQVSISKIWLKNQS